MISRTKLCLLISADGLFCWNSRTDSPHCVLRPLVGSLLFCTENGWDDHIISLSCSLVSQPLSVMSPFTLKTSLMQAHTYIYLIYQSLKCHAYLSLRKAVFCKSPPPPHGHDIFNQETFTPLDRQDECISWSSKPGLEESAFWHL